MRNPRQYQREEGGPMEPVVSIKVTMMLKEYLHQVQMADAYGVNLLSAHSNLRAGIREESYKTLIAYWRDLLEPKAVHCCLRLFPTHLRRLGNLALISHHHVQDPFQFSEERREGRFVTTRHSALAARVVLENHADH